MIHRFHNYNVSDIFIKISLILIFTNNNRKKKHIVLYGKSERNRMKWNVGSRLDARIAEG